MSVYSSIASSFAPSGNSKVITQKFIQTGCTGSSEDIDAHRRLCGGDNSRNLNASFFQSIERKDGMVYGAKSPVGHKYRRIIMFGDALIFSYPASAQLAAAIDGRTIDMAKIEACTMELGKNYDVGLSNSRMSVYSSIASSFAPSGNRLFH